MKGRGFTLVELAVVVVIIGVPAAFAVPTFISSVERLRVAEAFNYLSAVQAAQERYHARRGTYCDVITDLDIKFAAPHNFSVELIAAGSTTSLEDSWTLTLTRTGASAGYGEYTVVWNEEAFDTVAGNIVAIPAINPMET